MPPVHTRRGVPCPTCKGKTKGKTAHVALMPLMEGNTIVAEPHTYAVCVRCYRRQWKKVYPDTECQA
jgi:hypothetical protein